MSELAKTVSLDDAPEVALDGAALSEVAALAFALSQRDIERHNVRPAAQLVPFADMSDQAKANARATVYRVVQALVMLGYIAPPG